MKYSPYLAVVFSSIIYGLFYVLLDFTADFNASANFMVDIVVVAIFILGIISAVKGTIHEFWKLIREKELYYIVFFVVVLPFILLSIAAYHTSGLNIAIILLSELVFAYLLSLWSGEKSSLYQSFSSLMILFGSAFVVYKPGFVINPWDCLVLISGLFFAFGNFHAKKIVSNYAYEAVLFTRFVISLPFLVLSAILFENRVYIVPDFNYILAVLVSGVFVMTFSKYLWYYALSKLDFLPATAASMSYPAFTLIFTYLFRDEFPMVNQVIGLILCMVGLLFLPLSGKRLLFVKYFSKS